MAAAAGVVAAYSDITGDKWKPYEPPVAGPATVGRQEAKPRSPASGETIGAGSQDPALPPHSSLPDGPAGGRTPPRVKTRVKTRGRSLETGRRPLRRKPVGTDKKAPAHGARTA
jgi:hypothetical protein